MKTISKKALSVLLSVIMVLSLFAVIPASAEESSAVTAVALYKSHKIEWSSSKNSASSFTIEANGAQVSGATITSVTVNGTYYYTALVSAAEGTKSGTEYTVKDGTTVVGKATVADDTGLAALKKNALVAVDYGKDGKTFNTNTHVDLNVSAATVAKLAELKSGSIIYKANAEVPSGEQAVIALTNSAAAETGFFVGSRGNSTGFRFNGTWKGTFNNYSFGGKHIMAYSVTEGGGCRTAADGVNGFTSWDGRNDTILVNAQSGTITGAYIGAAKDNSSPFRGVIYFAIVSEELYTNAELAAMTELEPIEGSVPNVNSGSAFAPFDNNSGNNWVFVGGRDVQGTYADIGGAKSFMAQLKEYSYDNNPGSADGTNSMTGNPNRERYMINAGQTGRKLADIVNNFDKLVTVHDPRFVSYMVGVEDYADASEAAISAFKTNLTTFIQKGLAMRSGAGYVVIQNPYVPAADDLKDKAKAYALAVNEVVKTFTEAQLTKIAVVNHYTLTENDASFLNNGYNADGSLSAKGHLIISKQLESKVIRATSALTISNLNLNLKNAPTVYDKEAVVSAVMSGTTLNVTLPASVNGKTEWVYNLKIADSYTVSVQGGSTAKFTALPADKDYTLTIVSKDGTTQLLVMMGKTTNGKSAVPYAKTLTAQQQKVADLLKNKDSLTWMFMGDSITHGVAMGTGRAYDNLAEMFTKYLREDLGRINDTVVNTAVSSATTTSTLVRINERLNRYSPDVVSVQLGTNDATLTASIPLADYKKNLQDLVNAIKAKGAIAVIRAPIVRLDDKSAVQSTYVQAAKEVAQANDLIFIDQFTITTQLMNDNTYLKGGNKASYLWFANDNLHPGANGHIDMARMLIDGLGLDSVNSEIYNHYFETAHNNANSTVVPDINVAANGLTVPSASLSTKYGNAISYVTVKAVNGDYSYSDTVTVSAGADAALSNLPKGTYTVTVSADLRDASTTVAFASQTVTIEDGKEPDPDVDFTVEQNTGSGASGEAVATIKVDGKDLADDYTISFTDIEGEKNDNDKFVIDGDSIKVASDNLQDGEYSIAVKITSNGFSVVKLYSIVIENPKYKMGDVNSDGSVNAADAATILQYFAGIIDASEEGFNINAANVNGDKDINAADAAMVLQFFADIISEFPVK